MSNQFSTYGGADAVRHCVAFVESHARYAYLDGIRGIAAILVLTRHTGDYWHYTFFRRYLAVDLFFILSGFVIANAYEEKIRAGVISLRQFILIRLIRLYPVFVFSVLACAALLIGKLMLHHGDSAEWREAIKVIIATMFFLPSHATGEGVLFPLNSPYWSLFFELIVNFVFAALCRFLSNSRLLGVVTVFGLLCAALAYRNGSLDVGFAWGAESFLAGFSRATFGIFLGAYLYRHRGFFTQFFASPPIAWLAVGAIAAILASPGDNRFDWAIDILAVWSSSPSPLSAHPWGNVPSCRRSCSL